MPQRRTSRVNINTLSVSLIFAQLMLLLFVKKKKGHSQTSFAMARIYEFHLRSGVILSPNRCSKQRAFLRVQPVIITEGNPVSALKCHQFGFGGIKSYNPVPSPLSCACKFREISFHVLILQIWSVPLSTVSAYISTSDLRI